MTRRHEWDEGGHCRAALVFEMTCIPRFECESARGPAALADSVPLNVQAAMVAGTLPARSCRHEAMPGGWARRGIYWGTSASGDGLARTGLAPALRRALCMAACMDIEVIRAVPAGMPEIENQFRLVRCIGLPMKVAQMTSDRRRRDAERRSDDGVLLAAAAERENLALARCQPAALGDEHDRAIRLRRKTGSRIPFRDGPGLARGIFRARGTNTAEFSAAASHLGRSSHLKSANCKPFAPARPV